MAKQEESTSVSSSVSYPAEKEAVGEHANGDGTSQADDGDKYNHAVKRSGSWIGAVYNIMCISVGTGTMNLPAVVRRSGWFGVILMALMALIGWFVGILFRRAMYSRPGKRFFSFSHVTQAAFGRYGKIGFWFATIVTYVTCCGTVISWIIICGTQISRLLGFANVHLSEKICMTIIAIIMWVPFAILKMVSEITISSLFGVLTALFTVITLGVMSIKHRPNFSEPPTHQFIIGSGIPSALASIAFMYSSAIFFPHIEGNLKKPHQFSWALGLANILVCGCYTIAAATGYSAFGSQTVSPILNNLPNMAIINAANIIIIIHVIFASPIALVTTNLELEMALGVMPEIIGKKKELFWRLVMRTVTIGILLGVSIAIPYFGQFIDLISALSCTVAFFMVPIFCYVKLIGWRNIPKWELALCFILVIIGMIACVWGLIDAVKGLRTAIQNGRG
ncbi:hypothetical protein DL89DRAFT_249366 [Linderina pennispora]|uniref:Amino acid transporter transmembrane domain-containing protein n=1 Tax=Linderina pennispora TaxID=61395 RepID=A0A1Y1VZB4_9FUNG|nr:uncharacterized protein DL89DRAFT_249366 [Linderina pennispora]ORX66593.1 hypothetical protein DL89DRAFT_249366 [Linderina pennispora]